MRRVDWHAALSQHIVEWQGYVFSWGKHDCALFCAAGVEAMTGEDLARGFRGYRTEAGGLKRVQKKGLANHVDVFRQALPAAERLKVGDVAVVPFNGQEALGLVTGRGIHCMTEDRGLRMVPLTWASEGFAV